MWNKNVNKTRASMVQWGHWMHAHCSEIYYAETRPMPINIKPGHLPFTTDCSGMCTMIAKWAGAPDPNGADFSGWGYTGTMLSHLPNIPFDKTWRGDYLVYGGGTGTHVVMLLEGGVKTSNPLVVSHGQPAPNDPVIMSMAAMDDGFQGYERRFLQAIPGNK